MTTKPAVDTPSEAQVAPAAGPQLTVTVTSKMMQDYREQAPATDPRALALGWSPEGEIEVLTVGSDKRVYVLHHDVASPSGWSSLPLDFESTTSLFSMDVDNAYDRLFAVGNPAGQSYQFAELVREPGGGTSSWYNAPYSVDSGRLFPIACATVASTASTEATASYLALGVFDDDADDWVDEWSSIAPYSHGPSWMKLFRRYG